MKRGLIVRLCVALALLCVLAAFSYLWLNTRKADKLAAPDETTQTPVVEPSAPEELIPLPVSDDNGRAEATQVESSQPLQRETQEEPKGPNETLDPVAEAWAVVNHIKENLHEWGDFSPEAEAIMDRLMPVWEIDEASGEESMELLMELYKYRDPRSAEVLTAYIFDTNGFSPSYFTQMINLGPPSIPFVIPYFKEDFPEIRYAADIFVPIWQTNRDLLDGVAKHIVVPELERSLAEKEWQEFRDLLKRFKAAFE
ncbi:MAG: hypothetical protein OXT69_07775 [Candidatus Poribacteria bacterium]|nr:hypothetical protein [Candidatus Poribacteria bacterium]